MTYFRPNIEQMHGYVPGEQPKIPGLTRFNTNKNSYLPSLKALAALRQADEDPLLWFHSIWLCNPRPASLCSGLFSCAPLGIPRGDLLASR